jgi:hypothetical protein
MTSPLRLDPYLVAEAERASGLNKRSIPKQIEYWAELGRVLERVLDPADVLAVTQGLAEIQLIRPSSHGLDADELFDALEHDRATGALPGRLTRAAVYYESSTSQPGLLDQVQADGRRITGRFVDGEFRAVIAAG